MSEFDSFLHKYPLYVDGMILDMNAIYERYLTRKWVSPRILIELKEKGYRSPFEHEGIRTIDEVAQKKKRSKKRDLLINREQQSIILTTSGMMEGGPVYDYLRMGGSNSNNGLFIVGYQVEGTLGSDIASGIKNISLDNGFGQVFDVTLDLEVKKYEFSGHSSLEGLIQMAQYTTPQKIYAIHGEPAAQQRYSEELISYGFKANTLTLHDIIKF